MTNSTGMNTLNFSKPAVFVTNTKVPDTSVKTPSRSDIPENRLENINPSSNIRSREKCLILNLSNTEETIPKDKSAL